MARRQTGNQSASPPQHTGPIANMNSSGNRQAFKTNKPEEPPIINMNNHADYNIAYESNSNETAVKAVEIARKELQRIPPTLLSASIMEKDEKLKPARRAHKPDK